MQLLVHFFGSGPIIRWTCIFLALATNKSRLLHPRDIIRIGMMIVTAWPFFLIELDQDFLIHCLLGQKFFFLLAPITPKNLIGRRELHNLLNPGEQLLVSGKCLTKCFTRRSFTHHSMKQESGLLGKRKFILLLNKIYFFIHKFFRSPQTLI